MPFSRFFFNFLLVYGHVTEFPGFPGPVATLCEENVVRKERAERIFHFKKKGEFYEKFSD